MNPAGKTVLITGGGARLGARLAARFSERGARVLLHARTRRENPAFPVFYADFSRPAAVQKLWRELPPVDILINNASQYVATPLTVEDEAAFRRQFEVNFFAPVAMIRAFARQCPDGRGVAVNILDREIAGPGCCRTGSYGLSRRALAEATLEFARELAPGVRVAGVAPGPVLAPPGLEGAGMIKTLRTVPLARPVAVEDFLSAVEFLVGNDSITGEILFVDGGQHL